MIHALHSRLRHVSALWLYAIVSTLWATPALAVHQAAYLDYALQYTPAEHTLAECLGRVRFEVEQPVQWAEVTTVESMGPIGNVFSLLRISDKIGDVDLRMTIGGTNIQVIKVGEAPFTTKERLKDEIKVIHRLRLSELRRRIERDLDWIPRREKFLASLAIDDITNRTYVQGDIDDTKQAIQDSQRLLEYAAQQDRELDLDVPNTTAFLYSTDINAFILYALIEQDDYIVAFEHPSPYANPADAEAHFQALLQRWRPRALGEVPTEPGLCIPHGFIADDGNTPFYMKMAFRYPDMPGVLFSLQNSTIGDLGPETAFLTASARASSGRFLTSEQATVTHRVGPDVMTLAGLRAYQGGFALTSPERSSDYPHAITEAGKQGKLINGYSVFTGWAGSTSIPSLLLDMRSFSRQLAPELPSDPPAFELAKARMDAIVRSLRVRYLPPSAESH